MGWETAHLTSIKHVAPQPKGEASTEAQDPPFRTPRPGGERGRGEGRKPNSATAPATAPGRSELVNGLRFYRTPAIPGPFARLPILSQWEVVRSLERRLPEVIAAERPDVLQAHSPALDGVAAIRSRTPPRAARGLRVPRLLGGCRGRPRHQQGRRTALPADQRARDLGLPPRRCRHLHLRRSALRHRCQGYPRIKGDCDSQRGGYRAFRLQSTPRCRTGRASSACRKRLSLGFLGSFYAYEGLTLAVQALPAILEAHPNVRLYARWWRTARSSAQRHDASARVIGQGPLHRAASHMTRSRAITAWSMFSSTRACRCV